MPSVWRNATSFASATNLTALNSTTAYTLAFWVRGGRDGDIFAQASTANNARDGIGVWFDSVSINVRHCTATANTTYAALSTGFHRQANWQHYAIMWEAGVMWCFVNGQLMNRRAAANAPTANASCTTTIHAAIQSNYIGNLFDFQYFPNVFVPLQNVEQLMNPKVRLPGLGARYFGLEFAGVAASGPLRDESGNGSTLTVGATALHADVEPPHLPTLA